MKNNNLDLPDLHETLAQFDELLVTDHKVSRRPHPMGDIYAACQRAARLLGLPGNPVRTNVGVDATVAETANALGMSARTVSLTGHWWKQDLGLILVKEISSDKYFLLRSSHKRVPMAYTGPGHWGKYYALSREFATGLENHAIVLSPLLPDAAIGFFNILSKVLKLYPFEVSFYIFITLLIALLSYAIPISSGMVIDYVMPYRNSKLLVAIVVVVVVCNLIMFSFRYTTELVAQRLEAAVGTHVQSGVINRLFRLPLSFFSLYNSSDIMRRFTSIESARRMSLRLIMTTSIDLITLLVGLVILTYYSPLGALAVATLSFISLLAAFLLGNYSFSAFIEGEAMTTNVVTIVYEMVSNMLPIRMFGAEKVVFSRWRDNFVEMRRRTVRSSRYANILSSFQQVMSIFTLAIVFFILSYLTKPNDNVSIGYYVAFLSSLTFISGSVTSLAISMNSVFRLIPMVMMANPILTAIPESEIGRKKLLNISAEFDLVALSFRYNRGVFWALSNVSFSIKAGEYVGITGTSGCGKSTLVKILLGLLPPTKGQIFLDKHELDTIDIENIRQQCGVILQDYRMFAGSILENIVAGRDFHVDRVLEVLDLIGIGDYVRGLPMGIHTAISDNSSTFSGGQVQLLALARALVGNPKLLILDEATSGLDNKSLHLVNNVLDKLNITRIVFTHRLSALKNCNKIIVMEKGSIVEQGTFNELAQKNGLFTELLNGTKE